ncbi:hypothetical protein ACP70R_008213 [Stipagrostis hirtigluma subsp. patula]
MMMSSMASRAAAALRASSSAAARGRYGFPAPAATRSAATTAAAGAHPESSKKQLLPRGDYVPVYVALGLIALAVSLGAATARQQLAHAPNVRVDKKKRETVAEVAAPNVALDEAERFVGRSLFRKVAHVQDDRSLAAGVADPVAEYPTRKAVTLKDVGVDSPGIEQGSEGVLDKIFKKNKA